MKLLGAHQPLSAGRKHELLCQSSGSRPPAVITWWRDGQRLDTTTETVRISHFNCCCYSAVSLYLLLADPFPSSSSSFSCPPLTDHILLAADADSHKSELRPQWPVVGVVQLFFVVTLADHETGKTTTTNEHSDCSRVVYILLMVVAVAVPCSVQCAGCSVRTPT